MFGWGSCRNVSLCLRNFDLFIWNWLDFAWPEKWCHCWPFPWLLPRGLWSPKADIAAFHLALSQSWIFGVGQIPGEAMELVKLSVASHKSWQPTLCSTTTTRPSRRSQSQTRMMRFYHLVQIRSGLRNPHPKCFQSLWHDRGTLDVSPAKQLSSPQCATEVNIQSKRKCTLWVSHVEHSVWYCWWLKSCTSL